MKYIFISLAIIVTIWGWLDTFQMSGSSTGRFAPDFTVPLIEGEKLSLRDLRGEVVLLNFWASWCPPCRSEARDLEDAWQVYKDRDVRFLGINVQNDKAESARRFLDQFQITFPNGWDDGTISRKYGVYGIPRTFIISPEGKVTYIHMGTIRSGIIRTKLDEARRGLITAKEGEGSYQSTDAITIDELDRLLERTRNKEKKPLQTSPVKDKDRTVPMQAVQTYKGRWVKILTKDGLEREGRVVDVKNKVVHLEKNYDYGSISVPVPIQQIVDIQLLGS